MVSIAGAGHAKECPRLPADKERPKLPAAGVTFIPFGTPLNQNHP